ncbi:MAG TPA: ABC transporter substrate-binding protein [Kofleriaceae bacterium]|jgi:peptide/nickel transport system substrate-binding protein
MKALALAIFFALAACDAGQGTLHRHRDPGALVVAEAADVISLDPALVTDNESIQLGEVLFEGLVGWQPGTTDIEPMLATKWELSPDGKMWTFHLREHVRFHDGTWLDANAVAFSFERLLDPKHPYYLADAGYWRGLLQDVQRVVVVDPLTVEIQVSRPYAPLLGELAKYPIVSPAAVQRWGQAFGEHPSGTGPYQLETWNPGERVVVRRFDDYWGTPAALERLVFLVVVDARQRLIDLEAGSVDLATAILPDETTFVELHPDLLLYNTPGNDVCYLAFNVQHPPFDDVRVRRAANYAINKEPIIKLGYSGKAIAADGPLPPTQWGYHAPATRYPYDPAKARKLLAEAAADGRFDPDRTYKLYAVSTPRPYLPSPERVARLLKGALDEVGIKIELVVQPYQQHNAALQRGDHDLALFGWIGDTGDPDNFLYVLFDSESAHGADPQNVAFYENPEVDRLLAQAQATGDERQRSSLYAEVQDQISDDAPWVPIAHAQLVVAGRAELEHVIISPTGHPIFPLITRAEQR